MFSITIVEEDRGTNVASLLVDLVPLLAGRWPCHLGTAGSQNHLNLWPLCEPMPNKFRASCLHPTTVNATKPKIVGERKLAEPRLLGAKRLVAVPAQSPSGALG